jgi:hypothetical protein
LEEIDSELERLPRPKESQTLAVLGFSTNLRDSIAIAIHADVQTFDWIRLGSVQKFDVILMDPPWQHMTVNVTGRSISTLHNWMRLPFQQCTFIWFRIMHISSCRSSRPNLSTDWWCCIIGAIHWRCIWTGWKSPSMGDICHHVDIACIIHCSLFIVRCSLFTIHYSLFTIHYSLFTIHYSLFVIRHSFFTILHSSFFILCS